MTESLAILAVSLWLAGSAAGFLLPVRFRSSGLLVTALYLFGAAAGFGAGLLALAGHGGELRLPWALPLGSFHVGIDPLTGAFYLPLFLVSACVSVYAHGYWRTPRHQRRLRGFVGLLVAGIAVLLAARDAVVFLIGWETMALSAFFLLGAEDELPATRESAWVYLIATHCGTLLLFGFFALWAHLAGTLDWVALDLAAVGRPQAAAILLLALGGFGMKAGIMPLHFWLPAAHANAPSHVSALMSGLLIKCGVYGLLRMSLLIVHAPAWYGTLVLALGIVSGLGGVIFALAQHDLKRLLAYHSVENIGIIFVGMGIALLGGAERPAWVALGMTGAVLHVWNHALFKSLLFLGAGAVVKVAGTREIDRLGGLAKTMPFTAAMFLAGSVAITGLPPLNGFVSEFFIYVAGMQSIVERAQSGYFTTLAVPALALMGALAAFCFIKVYGAVFLGEPRTPLKDPGEAHVSMHAAMLVLAAVCGLIGLFPGAAYALLRSVVPSGVVASADALVPSLDALGALAIVLVAVSATGYAWLRRRALVEPPPLAATWSCGYQGVTPRMQYTASSFASTVTGLFRFLLRPREHNPAVTGIFPSAARYGSHVGEPVLESVLKPTAALVIRAASFARVLQHGRIQYYLVYVMVMLVVLFVFFWA